MSGGRSSDLQRAIDFLSGPELRAVDPATLPASADFGALLRLARARGVEIDEATLRTAFAMTMRARLFARPDPGRRP